MKYIRLIITALVLCGFNNNSSYSQERLVKDDIFYFDTISEVLQDCFQGWIFDRDSRQWYGNPNVILRSVLPQNYRKAKKGGFVYSQHTNIYNLQTASIVYDILGRGEKQRYYVLFWQKWKGYYDYPNIQEDWRWYRTYDYYIFSEDEWNKFQNIQASETIYMKYLLYGNVSNQNEHLLNDDIEYAVKHPRYIQTSRYDKEGEYSFFIRYADDGENIRFFINPERSVLNLENPYFEVKYSDFARIMFLANEDNSGKNVIKQEKVYIY